MSLPEEILSCAVCPRLCRDVCPVAVHAWRDDLIPSEKMRTVATLMGQPAGVMDPERLLACTDCGACTEHCLLSTPVGPWLDAARQRWVKEQGEALPPHRAPLPPIETLQLDAIEAPVYTLMTCGGDPDGCGATLKLEDGPETPRPERDLQTRRDDPWLHLKDIEGTRRHDPPLGSTCCGQRLREGVGDPELATRMARAMVASIPDGALVVVSDEACGAHIQRSVGDRLRILKLEER